LSERKLLPELQSAYRAYHSTETAVLRVLSDIFEALDRGDWAALTLLDPSAAFDTVDHTTLNRRLRFLTASTTSSSAGFRHTCATDRSTFAAAIPLLCHQFYCAAFHKDLSLDRAFSCCIRQIWWSRSRRTVCARICTPTTRRSMGFAPRPPPMQALLDQVAACISDVSLWMKSNRLLLNTDKTEALWCVRARHQHYSQHSTVRVLCFIDFVTCPWSSGIRQDKFVFSNSNNNNEIAPKAEWVSSTQYPIYQWHSNILVDAR